MLLNFRNYITLAKFVDSVNVMDDSGNTVVQTTRMKRD